VLAEEVFEDGAAKRIHECDFPIEHCAHSWFKDPLEGI
jgi:hypothetical protein